MCQSNEWCAAYILNYKYKEGDLVITLTHTNIMVLHLLPLLDVPKYTCVHNNNITT